MNYHSKWVNRQYWQWIQMVLQANFGAHTSFGKFIRSRITIQDVIDSNKEAKL